MPRIYPIPGPDGPLHPSISALDHYLWRLTECAYSVERCGREDAEAEKQSDRSAHRERLLRYMKAMESPRRGARWMFTIALRDFAAAFRGSVLAEHIVNSFFDLSAQVADDGGRFTGQGTSLFDSEDGDAWFTREDVRYDPPEKGRLNALVDKLSHEEHKLLFFGATLAAPGAALIGQTASSNAKARSRKLVDEPAVMRKARALNNRKMMAEHRPATVKEIREHLRVSQGTAQAIRLKLVGTGAEDQDALSKLIAEQTRDKQADERRSREHRYA